MGQMDGQTERQVDVSQYRLMPLQVRWRGHNVMSIYIAHRRGTSNALYALVRCKQKRLYLFPETVSADGRVSQILWQ